MAGCEYGQHLSAYHDGELPPEVKIAIERHLPECPPCADELELLRELSGLVGELMTPSTSSVRVLTTSGIPASKASGTAAGTVWGKLPTKVSASSLSLLHGEVDRWCREQGDGRLLRIARVLTGLAACLLIGAGLWVFGSSHRAPPEAVAQAKPWEQVAVTLQTEIPSAGGIDLATDWVLADATLPATVE